MAKLKCDDCGQIFDDIMQSCPNCGCPKSACHAYEEPKQETTEPEEPKQEQQQKNESSSQSAEEQRQEATMASSPNFQETEENYYYTDFNWFESFSSDPWLLTSLQTVRWLRWLCAPWHIGGKGNKDVDHVIANDIFFILNRFWKLMVYPEVWAIVKALPFVIAIFLLVAFVGGAIFTSDSVGGVGAGLMIFFVVYLVAVVFGIWLWFIGLGKSCHRYGIPMIRRFRHLCAVFVKSIK